MYSCDILSVNGSTDSMALLEHNAFVGAQCMYQLYCTCSRLHATCYVYDNIMLMFTKISTYCRLDYNVLPESLRGLPGVNFCACRVLPHLHFKGIGGLPL